jgi:hypothetical protein
MKATDKMERKHDMNKRLKDKQIKFSIGDVSRFETGSALKQGLSAIATCGRRLD